MPGPKSRISKSRRGMRRAHNALKVMPVSTCANCGSLAKPHHVCSSCGYYKGKEVMAPKGL